jgi:hypothetical protein
MLRASATNNAEMPASNGRSAIARRAMRVLGGTALVGAVALAGCSGPHAPPPPAAPPPRKVVTVPPLPVPPNGASANLTVPPLDSSGLRQSVNRNISDAQSIWNLRSAYNVAALNCTSARHAQLVPLYRAFLKTHAKALAKANRTIDQEFKAKYGARFVGPREQYMTSVYNHFALPPTLADFCDATLAMAHDAATVKPVEFEAFAVRSLPNIEVVFDAFYRRYDAYRSDVAAWHAQYGDAQPGAQIVVASGAGKTEPTEG